MAPAPVLISGTLKPLTLAINGQKILSQDVDEEIIFINDKEIGPEKQDLHRSVFHKVNADQIEVKNSKGQIILNINLPALLKLESKNNKFLATVNSPNLTLKVDEQVFAGEQTDYQIFESADEHDPWFQTAHTLSLLDPLLKVERLYVFESSFDIPARKFHRAGVELGTPEISSQEVDLALGGFYDYIFANHFLLGAHLTLPLPKSGSPSFDNGYMMQIRGGYQIFRKENALHSPVWLEAGIGIQQVTFTRQYHSTGGSVSERFERRSEFFYISSQPLVVGGVQLGFSLQGGPRAAEEIPNVLMNLTAAYEW